MALVEKHTLDLADADTLEQFYLSQTNTLTGFLQLSPGDAVLDACSLQLGDLRILQVDGDGNHLWTDCMGDGEWRFAILTKADSTMRMAGTELAPTSGALLRPGEAAEFLTNGRYQTLEITFSETMARERGWPNADPAS